MSSDDEKVKDSDFSSEDEKKKNKDSFIKNLDEKEKKKENESLEINTSKKDEKKIGFDKSNYDISKDFQDKIDDENSQNHDIGFRKGRGRGRGRGGYNYHEERNNSMNNNQNDRQRGFGGNNLNDNNYNNQNDDNRQRGFGNNNNNDNNNNQNDHQRGFGRNNNSNINNNNNYNQNDNNRQRGFGRNDNNDFHERGFRNNFNDRNFRRNKNFNYNQNFPDKDYERARINYKDGRGPFNRNRRGGFNNNINPNFDFNNYYYENKMKEKEKEKEKPNNPRIDNIKNEYKDIIILIEKIYSNLIENEIATLIDSIQQKKSQTIFESMNDIYCYNSIQLAKKNYKKRNNLKPFLDNSELNIFEQINLKYLSKTLQEILQFYKVYSFEDKKKLNLPFPDSFYYEKEEERRRILKKNEDGIYNYIPIQCKAEHNNKIESENCNYSHNHNEIAFHSLIYKTKRCTKKDCINQSTPELCCNSHNFENDFRIIYNYLDNNIIELMCKFESKLEKKIRKYEQCYNEELIEESDFDLNTFKILECNSEYTECDKDYHLCHFYHNKNERRRPPKLFRYCSLICENVFSNGKFYPDSCIHKDYCHYCHNYYEFYYHEDNFRKVIPCLRNKIENTNECVFYETCYGIHNNNQQLNIKNKEDKKSEKEILLDECKKKYNILKEKINHFGCLNCGKLPKNKIFYLIKKYHNKKQLHFLCTNCKTNCNNICPVCNTQIDENDYIEIPLEPNNTKE